MKYLIVLLFLISTVDSFSCCAEHNYRLYPIGERNNHLVFISFDVFRNCKNPKGNPGGGAENEFWINGIINLVHFENDSLIIDENIDTISVKECICTYKNHYEKSNYESLLNPYYTKALSIAKKKKGFTIATPTNISFNDTTITHSTETDSSFIITYKNQFSIDLYAEEIISNYPSNLIEIREYETTNFSVTILRLSTIRIKNTAIPNNTKRFKNIETAFWTERAAWHGIAKDYLIVNPKIKD